MSKPTVILDPHWRRMDELFSEADQADLREEFEVIWGQDDPIPTDLCRDALDRAFAIVSSEPRVDADLLQSAPDLKAVAEISGAFPGTIDYGACAARGVEVLSCAPGFRNSVAEMAVAMALAGARGLVAEHERFRAGTEGWVEDRSGRDFTLFGASVGFVGYGSIAREIHRLLRPFKPQVFAFDPWLDPEVANREGVEITDLATLAARSRCFFVTAAPTRENKGLIDAKVLSKLTDGALLLLISRAHLVDFGDLQKELATGRITAALDVFPTEPVADGDTIRQLPNVILSPHRAAAVDGGRQQIGHLLLKDLRLVLQGQEPANLTRAATSNIGQVAGVGDATRVAAMAAQRAE